MVGGIVSPVSDGYGKQGLVLAKHRIAMAKLALQSSDWVKVDEWESQQPDWTETVVTMRYKTHLQQQQCLKERWSKCRIMSCHLLSKYITDYIHGDMDRYL